MNKWALIGEHLAAMGEYIKADTAWELDPNDMDKMVAWANARDRWEKAHDALREFVRTERHRATESINAAMKESHE